MQHLIPPLITPFEIYTPTALLPELLEREPNVENNQKHILCTTISAISVCIIYGISATQY